MAKWILHINHENYKMWYREHPNIREVLNSDTSVDVQRKISFVLVIIEGGYIVHGWTHARSVFAPIGVPNGDMLFDEQRYFESEKEAKAYIAHLKRELAERFDHFQKVGM